MKTPLIKLIIATLVRPVKRSFFMFAFGGLLLSGGALMANHTPVLMRLVAYGNQMLNETVVYFDSSATFNYDPEYDAPSLGVDPGALHIVTRLSNIDYQVNAMPVLTQNISVPVKITTGLTGLYQVYANELQNLPEGAAVTLYDTYYNTTFDLRSGYIQYLVTDTEQVARFVLNITVSQLQNVTSALQNPTCNLSGNGYLYASGPGNGLYNYYWKDSMNNIIKTSLNKSGADTLSGANAGAYRVDVNTVGSNDNATLYFDLFGSQSARAHFSVASHTITLTNGYATAHFTNTSLNGSTFWWDFGDGMGTAQVQPTHNYYQLGTYTVTLSCSNQTCADVSAFKEIITVIGGTTSMADNIGNTFLIAEDAAGCYIEFGTAPEAGIVSVINLLGQKICADKPLIDQKMYLGDDLPGNEVLIVQVIYDSGKKRVQKFIK